MINVNQITSYLAKLQPDSALQRYAQMHKQDPYILSLALAESNRRKETRAGAQMRALEQPKVVDQELAAMASVDPMGNYVGSPLPETVGIGRLPAKNLARMAMGGIVAFDDGGEVPRYNKGGSLFDQAVARTLKYEGGYTEDTGGPTMYGISQRANPDVDVKSLTPEKAKQIYKERYWDAISGDKLAKMNPALAQVAFDTAVNQGVDKAKELVTKSGGDPAKLLELRGQHYASLVKADPERYGKFEKGWNNRLADLATSVIPSATAAELDRSVPAPVSTKTPAQAPATQGRSQWEAIGDAARGVLGAGETALQYGTGLLSIPTAGAYAQYRRAMYGEDPEKVFREAAGSVTYQPRTEAGTEMSERFGRTLEDLKIPGYMPMVGPRAPRSKPGPAASDLAAIAAEKEAQVATPRLAGPTTDKTMVQKPGQAPVKDGTLVRQQLEDIEGAKAWRQAADEAAQREGLGSLADEQAKLVQQAQEAQRARLVGAGATVPGQVAPYGAGAGAGAVQLGSTDAADYAAFGQETDPMAKLKGGVQDLQPAMQQAMAQAPETAGGKGGLESLFSNPLFLMGAHLMSGQSPFAAQNIGQAGIGTATMLAAQKKAEREEDYYSALAQRARSLAKTEGLTGNTQLAYFLGEGDTTEKRVKTGLPILTAMNTQIKALELTAEQQKNYWDYVTKTAQAGGEPLDPRNWALKSRAVTAFTQPRGVNTIAEGQSVYGR